MMRDSIRSTLLTIVTINLNNGSNLSRTLKSLDCVRADSEIECLFIDGASKDHSLQIAKEFYLPEKLISEPDRGIYHAMNKGLARAQGDYVLWLNSGDELLPGGGAIIKDVLRSMKSVAMISFGVEVIPEHPGSPSYVKYPSVEDLPHAVWPHQSTCFRKDMLLKLGGYSEIYTIASDYDAMLKIYFQGLPLRAVPQVVSRFYAGGRSSSVDVMYEWMKIQKEYRVNTAVFRAYLRMRLFAHRAKNVLGWLYSYYL